ncbi:MAG: flap endonuclease-1 [Candidatus Odinarchaeum yellowstonii]|uniref:Flap endonuclease 1 n=1 Tax=Odinarchaeota yellowstonii (strain LCB_4) TaxID=1841599 RepID=A0AAF0D0V9_ODILC|nr:MAG: flap endonuclease-1 [Candidatus Odinarchaeum yellowstonii]
MGVNIRDLVKPTPISFEELNNKVIAIDAYNALYQFLSIIRQYDGMPLIDKNNNITSHLSGLFYRTINLIENGVKPVYVFDGKPPSLKIDTIKAREEVRKESQEKWSLAVEAGDYEGAKKYAQASSALTKDMVEESKTLLKLMGVPFIEAPSEGEAQAAYMNMKGDVWACASQDWDSLLFGAHRLVRNLTVSGRRKLPGKQVYIKVEVELVTLEQVLKDNNITRDQLIDIGILVGTDYNEGVKGIGPKSALNLIRKHGSIEKVLENEGIEFNQPLEEIRRLFKNPDVTDNYTLHWSPPKEEQIIELLNVKHDFSLDRVKAALDRIREYGKTKPQSRLDQYFTAG